MIPTTPPRHPFGIVTLDAEYVRPGLAAVHLIVEQGRAAIIDTGTNAAVPHVLAALADLDPRSRRIVEERWLKVNDDGTGGMTLHDLAAEYQVSAERIRQIEVAAMKKMRQSLAAFA
jgi:DNA-directed RNA polymerase sigma subunit (sigma70/sigma32)